MNLAVSKYRWLALVFLALGLAIVIIDNTVLNVAVPYIIKDLNTTLDGMQWVISGYALIIATLLITVGRLGDLWGRKKVFILGCVLFAIGSFIASVSKSVGILFLGEALIEAIGAAMMLTSSLSLIATEFQSRERAIAFGVWGSVAGASAAIGPLLGGYLTAYHSWRWSLRINVFVAIIAILGSVFVMESKGEEEKRFDWWGTLFSGAGLFALIFALIEGQKFGWWHPKAAFNVLGWTWQSTTISVIPFALALSAVLLSLFVQNELRLERKGESPLLRMSMFKNLGLTLSLLTVSILSLGQLGTFFVLPIFLQNVLGLDAFKTGLTFIPASAAALILGPLSGFISSKIGPKWIVAIGMFLLAAGGFWLHTLLAVGESNWHLAPAFVVFGIGMGMSMAQLTNLIVSSAPITLVGEASAANSTMRQVGSSIGIAIIGTVLAGTLVTNITKNVNADPAIPAAVRQTISSKASQFSVERGSENNFTAALPPQVAISIQDDINKSLTQSSKTALRYAIFFILLGAVSSLFIPNPRHSTH